MSYWAERQAKAQERLTLKNRRAVDKQLRKYYGDTMKSIIGQFELVYNELMADKIEGREHTPADLYKMDKYWKLVAQLERELRALGDKELVLMAEAFERDWFDVYYSTELNLPDAREFATLDTEIVQQMINEIWCADGKSWSDRVWINSKLLQETLNQGLIECVAAGRKTTELKNILQERFGVSYGRANRIVRTEMAHIQTQAAKKRYQDYGLTEYEVLGNHDDTCGNHSVDCHKMHGKKFKYSEMRVGVNAPPFHPNCKCSIIPVVDVDI